MKGSVISLRVCLVGCIFGRMEKKEWRIGEKMSGRVFGWKRRGREKWWGQQVFSLPPLQNTISPNWRENWSKKWEKYLNKTAPPLLTFLAFFFLLFLSLVMLAFCFCLCFCFFVFYFFFIFSMTWWVFLLFLFFFFKLFTFFFEENTFGWFLMLFFEMSTFIYTQFT